MVSNSKYKVIVSDRAKRMLGTHIRFMAQVNNCLLYTSGRSENAKPSTRKTEHKQPPKRRKTKKSKGAR